MNESCYYDLAIDYQFTFNLSKPEDKHYTAINFKNIPTKADVDVDFQITCSVPAKVQFQTFQSSISRSYFLVELLTVFLLIKTLEWYYEYLSDEPDISDG